MVNWHYHLLIFRLVLCTQFLPVVDGQGKEKELITNVMKKVLAENDFSGLDVNKVIYSIHTFELRMFVSLSLKHFIFIPGLD